MPTKHSLVCKFSARAGTDLVYKQNTFTHWKLFTLLHREITKYPQVIHSGEMCFVEKNVSIGFIKKSIKNFKKNSLFCNYILNQQLQRRKNKNKQKKLEN